MIPIQDLLNRVRWDEEYGRADFVIAYLDRFSDTLVEVPLAELSFSNGDRFDFELTDEEGRQLSIPLHRIKSVYRNGILIWHREH